MSTDVNDSMSSITKSVRMNATKMCEILYYQYDFLLYSKILVSEDLSWKFGN